MESFANGHYCPSCKHMMIVLNVAGILREHNLSTMPVTVTANYQLQQQCPGSSYSTGEDGDEVIQLKQEVISKGEMESDQWSLYSEGISYEETDSDYNDNSYNSLDDQLTTLHTCIECCTVGHDELVIPKLHNWSLSSNNEHTTVCRYCREEVNNSYYDHHLVKCIEKWEKHGHNIKSKKTRFHNQECNGSSVEETRHFNDCSFTVNCIATEETAYYSCF